MILSNVNVKQNSVLLLLQKRIFLSRGNMAHVLKNFTLGARPNFVNESL